ncbi:MAG TPA: hypothetical protein VFF32_03205 [Dermatophilaceae bacterium]|nr:hypothetical protein [Dermatophilaceae bacterium]
MFRNRLSNPTGSRSRRSNKHVLAAQAARLSMDGHEIKLLRRDIRRHGS